jgi:hypothetical protein
VGHQELHCQVVNLIAVRESNMETIYKFGWIPNEERRYEYPDIFAVEKTSGPKRLVIAPSAHHVSILIDLLQVMSEPLGILYVLVVPRGGSDAGRYQVESPVSQEQAKEFLERFRDYFENDGRHDIWVRSVSDSSQLVYDRHNVIYAYGPLLEFEKVLLGRGLANAEFVRFPSPHTHNYHAVFDQDERDVLRHWHWRQSPLRESDD